MSHRRLRPLVRNRTVETKYWVFTLNNPTFEEKTTEFWNFTQFMYIIIGNEVSVNGTPHYQGMCVFVNKKRLSAVQKVVPRAHWEIMKGSVLQASQYCKKEGQWLERGMIPLSHQQAMTVRWKTAIALAKAGTIDDIEPMFYVRYYHAWKRIRQDNPDKPQRLVTHDNYWIVAPTGYGKSWYARERWPDYYDKAPNKWWTGYKGQKTVICDDFGPNEFKYLTWYIKRWADLYAFPMETKGGGSRIRPDRLVVTSQYTIEESYDDYRVVEAIQRRFKVIDLDYWIDRRKQNDVNIE